MRTALPPLLLAAALLAACEAATPLQEQSNGGVKVIGGPAGTTAANGRTPLTPEAARLYLTQLAPLLVGRELNLNELELVHNAGEPAVKAALLAWTTERGFQDAARLLIQQQLSASGTKNGVDFELPGNLAAYLAKQRLPLTLLLTADYCVSAAGAKIDCDSGAPFKAGVLTTRAFLMGRAGRFNLTRAGTLMKVFACRHYPMEDELQPRLERSTLIPMFQSQTPEEQTNPAAASGFGNGFACYTCHGQFSAHAQVFVRFDATGIWRGTATGLQEPAPAELGRSPGNLFASHLQDPGAAKLETSQVFGKAVANLAEAGRVIADSPTFLPCQARNFLELALGLDASTEVPKAVLDEVTAAALAANPEPDFAALMVATFTHPRVMDAVVAGIGAAP